MAPTRARVWDAATGALQLELKVPPEELGSVGIGAALSPDGTRIVTITGNFDKTAKV